MGVQNIQQLEDSYGFIVLYFIHNYTHQWRTQGGVSGVQTPPPPEIPRTLQKIVSNATRL